MSCKIKGCLRSCDGVSHLSKNATFTKTNTNVDPYTTTTLEVSEILLSPDPIPYTFRIPAPSLQMCRRQNLPHTARAPPFCLQLDHTLAVLWNLFRKKAGIHTESEVELGIAQLQWALYFLKGVKPPNGGDRAEDVSIAIQTVEDALLDLYADMSNVVLQTPKDPPEPDHFPSFKDDTSCTVCDEVRNLKRSMLVEDWVPSSSVRSCGKCTSSTLGDIRPRKSSKRETHPETITSKKNFKCGIDQSIIINECGPGGVCSPWTKKEKVPSESLLQNSQLTQEILHLKTMASELNKRAPHQTDVSQITMLQEWRKEQISRVEEELERLKNLDAALGVQSNADVALNSLHTGIHLRRHLSVDFTPPHSSSKLE